MKREIKEELPLLSLKGGGGDGSGSEEGDIS